MFTPKPNTPDPILSFHSCFDYLNGSFPSLWGFTLVWIPENHPKNVAKIGGRQKVQNPTAVPYPFWEIANDVRPICWNVYFTRPSHKSVIETGEMAFFLRYKKQTGRSFSGGEVQLSLLLCGKRLTGGTPLYLTPNLKSLLLGGFISCPTVL